MKKSVKKDSASKDVKDAVAQSFALKKDKMPQKIRSRSKKRPLVGLLVNMKENIISESASNGVDGDFLASSKSASLKISVARPETKKIVKLVPMPEWKVEISDGVDPGHFPMDEVHDEGEEAQWIQLKEQARIGILAQELARPEYHADFDGLHCVDCDIEIPEFRLKINRVRCKDCQELVEEEKDRLKRLGK